MCKAEEDSNYVACKPENNNDLYITTFYQRHSWHFTEVVPTYFALM